MSELDQFDVSYAILRKKVTKIVGHFNKSDATSKNIAYTEVQNHSL